MGEAAAGPEAVVEGRGAAVAAAPAEAEVVAAEEEAAGCKLSFAGTRAGR